MQRIDNKETGTIEMVLNEQDLPLVVQVACVIAQKTDKNFTESMARALYAWLSMELDFSADAGVVLSGMPEGQTVKAGRDERGYFLRFEEG